MNGKNKSKPSVGQILFRLNIGNNARNVAQTIKPVFVKSVGRKYFTVITEGGVYELETKHRIEDWQQENGGYSPGYALYESEQEWQDDKEKNALTSTIKKTFAFYGSSRFSLEALRAINSIIEESAKDVA